MEPLGADGWEMARVLAGRPAPGAELTQDFNPLEAGLYHAVSVTKARRCCGGWRAGRAASCCAGGLPCGGAATAACGGGWRGGGAGAVPGKAGSSTNQSIPLLSQPHPQPHTAALPPPTQGCYVGQETIAKVHNLSAVKQQLWGLDMESPCKVGDAVLDARSKAALITASGHGCARGAGCGAAGEIVLRSEPAPRQRCTGQPVASQPRVRCAPCPARRWATP